MPSSCVLCGRVDESASHLFLGCGFAASVWKHLLHKFGVRGVPSSLEEARER